MTNKREYWLTKAITNLVATYDFLGEATGLAPENEAFDNAIEENRELLYSILNNLELLKKEQQK